MKWISLIIFYALINICSAQTVKKNQLTVVSDNDIFAFFRPISDRYYTNGLLFEFRKSLDEKSKIYAFLNSKLGTSHLTQGYHLRQNIYTPTRIALTDLRDLDRPFAGILAAGYSLQGFLEKNRIIKAQLDLGILGPASGAEFVQTELHTQKDFTIPTGWRYQINHIPLINLNIDYLKAFSLVPSWVDIIYEGRLELGSVYNNINQGATLRIGKIASLNTSGYSNGIIGSAIKKGLNELYFIAGVSLRYAIYDATIQGDHPSRELTPINDLENWVITTKFGFNLHFQKFDISYHYFFNTNENERADNHYFSRIQFSYRF